MIQTTQFLTNSRMSCARTCPRKHYLRYELGLRPDHDSAPLRIGTAFHLALELHDLGQDAIEAVRALDNLDEYEKETVLRLYLGHVWRWQSDGFDVVAPEQQFDLPLTNPATGAPTPCWRVAGKMDRIVRLADGRLALQEYKTTSDDIAPGSDYWVRLRLDQQVSLYFIAARELGFDVQTVIYDVTRKPALRPLKATPEESRKYTKEGKLYAAQRLNDETPEEYGERVNEDIAARPDFYFARVELPRFESDLDEFRRELWQQQLVIRAAQRSGAHYRNTSACVSPYQCEYLAVCGNRDLETNTPAGFVRSTNVHPELSPRGASLAAIATPGAIPAIQ